MRFWTLALAVALGGCGERSTPAPSPGPQDATGTTGAEERTTDAFARAGLEDLRPLPRVGWPVERVHITSPFGWRVDPVSGVGTRLHRGVDFRGAPGDPVLSIAAGTVQFAGHDPLLGKMIIVEHEGGVESLYGHLSDTLVHEGLPVARGAAIGLVGNTGRSAAPHLHLTVKVDGEAIDPLHLIGEPLQIGRGMVPPPLPAAPPVPGATTRGPETPPPSGTTGTGG